MDFGLLTKLVQFYNVDLSELTNDNSLNMIFNDKVDNGYIHHIQTLNQDNKELLLTLKKQLEEKDKQINELLMFIKKKEIGGGCSFYFFVQYSFYCIKPTYSNSIRRYFSFGLCTGGASPTSFTPNDALSVA